MDQISGPHESKHENFVRSKYLATVNKLEEMIIELDFLASHTNDMPYPTINRLIHPREYLIIAQKSLIDGKMWLNKFIYKD